MDYLVEIKDVPESKPLLDYLRTLKYVKVKDEASKPVKKRIVSDEEMALPMRRKPSKEELSDFLDRKQGKGTDLETVRKRVLKNLAANRKK